MMRWTLKDMVTLETVSLPYNPNTMTSPHAGRGTIFNAPSPKDGRVRTHRGKASPQDWSFGGFIRTEAHYTLLQTWVERGHRVELTDHLGRVFSLRLVQFIPNERRPTRRVAWRFTYTMSAMVLGRIS